MRFRRFAQILLTLVCFSPAGWLFAAGAANTATITIDGANPGTKISPTLWGIFFEEINRAGDGGLYAEMVQNRSFEDAPDQPRTWTVLRSPDSQITVSIDSSRPLNSLNQHALKMQIAGTPGRAGIANGGWGGMRIRAGAGYKLQLHARCSDDFKGGLVVSLEHADGTRACTRQIEGLSSDWNVYTAEFMAEADDSNARLAIRPTGAGTVCLDVVSLFPRATFKNRANGLRADLAQMLAGLKPSFVRFPGGCFVEGDTLATSWRWKHCIGDIAQRPGRWNLWGYRVTDGLGFHEYLQMCEDLGATPLFVINCGMSHKENVPMDKMPEWVQDALDAIEYANGPTDSKWGSLRAKAGHPAPFGLKYMEIGNENGGGAYNERYPLFYDAIKSKYPYMQLVADEWSGRPGSRPIDIVDEHYYSSPEFFIANASRYDSYDRKGPKIYVGEYAVTQGCGKGNLRAAVGEAAFMTGIERNSDVVVMASYAPLFVRMDSRQWNPDLINFDNARAFGTPSYHVQQMFARNTGDVVLPVQIDAAAPALPPVSGAVGVGTWLTQAEYKDIRVTSGDKVLAEGALGGAAWKPYAGKWAIADGAYRQTDGGDDRRSIMGEKSWTDYTISLKARKLGGAEGFLILFHVMDDNNYSWWNIGGWGNTRHAIEVARNGGKGTMGQSVAGKVETGRWYDIRIETRGQSVKCYLDGKLIHDVEYAQSRPLYASASRGKNAVYLKVVNVSTQPYDVHIRSRGLDDLTGAGSVRTLSSPDPADENSLDDPEKVSFKGQNRASGMKGEFRRTLPGNSVTLILMRKSSR